MTFDELIIDSAKSIANATSSLIKAASEAATVRERSLRSGDAHAAADVRAHLRRKVAGPLAAGDARGAAQGAQRLRQQRAVAAGGARADDEDRARVRGALGVAAGRRHAVLDLRLAPLDVLAAETGEVLPPATPWGGGPWPGASGASRRSGSKCAMGQGHMGMARCDACAV